MFTKHITESKHWFFWYRNGDVKALYNRVMENHWLDCCTLWFQISTFSFRLWSHPAYSNEICATDLPILMEELAQSTLTSP